MDYKRINGKISEIYQECNVKSFPINCKELIGHYGYKLHTYHDLKEKNKELFRLCVSFSEDAFSDKASRVIAYNEKIIEGRIRFSLMHELGHIALNHLGESRRNETEANYFASNILAPRVAIHYSHCQNAEDVKQRFGLTGEASIYAFSDYCRWHDRMAAYSNKLSAADREIYRQFYDMDRNCFIWSRNSCKKCGCFLFNTPSFQICKGCRSNSNLEPAQKLPYFQEDENSQVFHALEYSWLYGNDF